MTMQDRFLVRYWVKDSKKYLNSNKLVYNDGTFTQVSTKQLPNGTHMSYILYDWNTFEVIPEQCTGLKDKNDKLIYEGDIVKGKATMGEGGFEYLGYIKWCYQSELIGWYIEDKDGGAWSLNQAHAKISADNITGEVIGNIHENADLLENKDE